MIGTAHGSLYIAPDPKATVANLDEDEATLAVDAALIALDGVDRLSITSLEIGSINAVAEPPSWGAHVRIALGLRNASITGLATPTPSSNGLRIISDAGRGASGRPAQATAELGTGIRGHDAPTPRPLSIAGRRPIDSNHAQRIAQAETRCLAQVPMGAFVSRATWDASLEARYRLITSTCGACAASHHPPVDPCPRCRRPTVQAAHAEGSLHTWTTIAKGGGPTEFDEWQALDGDYGVAIVDLAPGVRVAGMMMAHDPKALRIGQRMRAVFRRLYAQQGEWRYGVKFQALEDAAGR